MTDKEKYLKDTLELIQMVHEMDAPKGSYYVIHLDVFTEKQKGSGALFLSRGDDFIKVVEGSPGTVIEALKKRANEEQKKREENKARQEKREQAQYERLKAKFEGKVK